METNEKIHGALTAIANEMTVGKDKKNNFGGYKYRDLPSIRNAAKPLMAKYGVSYTFTATTRTVDATFKWQPKNQPPQFFPYKRQELSCTIRFVSTEDGSATEVKTVVGIDDHAGMSTEQCYGSAMTYAEKFLLTSAFKLDDDSERIDPDSMQPQQTPTAAPRKRTFEECKNGFYAVYNQGNIDGAKKTLGFILANWGNDPDKADEIRTMQTVDLTQK